MFQSKGSGGLPPWLVIAGGVALGVALVAAYVARTLPPDTGEIVRASYERGYQAGADRRGVQAREVRRTPLVPSSGG